MGSGGGGSGPGSPGGPSCPPPGGDGGGCFACGGGPSGPSSPGTPIYIPTLHATDPNEIQGPFGVTLKKWMAAKDKYGYTVRFENDPDFANGPAQKVLVSVPIDPKFNINTLRIGQFGFGNMFFDVPPNSPTYYNRLDLRDSLGVYVDVLAGIDITGHQALWVFESIDPATGAEPINASMGFLPVRDTSINRFNDSIPNKGEGFVTYYIQPIDSVHTGDSVNAQASILFDLNAPVVTNITGNTVDAVSPVSAMASTPTVLDENVRLSWTGQDDLNGSGIHDYALYVSVNGGPFALYKDKITSTSVSFDGIKGNTYCFFTQATDSVGNQEPLKQTCEATVTLGQPLPITWLYFTAQPQGDNVLLNWATVYEINTRSYIIERSLDGREFDDIGSTPARGNSSSTSNYSYLDINAMNLHVPVLYYRIKQVDADGKFIYSIIVTVQPAQNNTGQPVTAYPNPFTNQITLKIMSVAATRQHNQVALYTLDGKLLYQRDIGPVSGSTILLNDLPRLAQGVYLLRTSINGELLTIKMIHE